jgi:carboxypeptidase Taq
MAKRNTSSYQQLAEYSREIQTFQSILSLLHWDQETYMPAGAIAARSEQIALLSEWIHERRSSRTFRTLLSKLVHLSSGTLKAQGLTRVQRAAVREWHKQFLRSQKLPAHFVKNFAQVTAEASQIWAIARKDSNFKLFAPFLEKIVRLSREKAEIYGFVEHPYDALLESYEPCMTSAKIARLFDGLQKELTVLLRKIMQAQAIDNAFLHKAVPDAVQREIALFFAQAMPVDSGYTRLDVSSHPFSTALHPKDSRITTRFLPKNFMSNIFSVFHEAGHSMYEMGLPTETWGTPLSEATSLSIHESQSRWWETLIGRSFPFWKHFYPRLQKMVPRLLKGVSLERFYRAIHAVTPSFIRVEADEVTYCLHVILRFDIEKRLIEGTLSTTDLPDAWNQKFKELFGVVPPNAAQGCLQDIHWSLGDFGYFPTYALGNLLAAQFFGAFTKTHPDWESLIASGNLGFVRDWLRHNIHRYGKQYNTEELAKRISRQPLSEAAYCTYLKKKYATLYTDSKK